VPDSKRVTLHDVARVSGFSVSAVSMILNDRPGSRLSDDARVKVKAAAEALGYRPNIAARSLRTDRTHTIGFISDVVASTRYASGLIRGALDAAGLAGHVVLVAETIGDPDREAESVAAMLDRQIDGIIFASMRAREISITGVPRQVPVVVLNATTEQYPRSVTPDEIGGGEKAIRHLIEMGHSEGIVILGAVGSNQDSALHSKFVLNRMEGIRRAMRNAGIEFISEASFSLWEPKDGYLAAKRELSKNLPITAFLCMNDRVAFGAYQAIAESGLRVAKDISVLSFDNDELAGYLQPGLSTVGLPYKEMGIMAVKALLEDYPDEEHLIDMPLIQRGSVSRL